MEGRPFGGDAFLIACLFSFIPLLRWSSIPPPPSLFVRRLPPFNQQSKISPSLFLGNASAAWHHPAATALFSPLRLTTTPFWTDICVRLGGRGARRWNGDVGGWRFQLNDSGAGTRFVSLCQFSLSHPVELMNGATSFSCSASASNCIEL